VHIVAPVFVGQEVIAARGAIAYPGWAALSTVDVDGALTPARPQSLRSLASQSHDMEGAMNHPGPWKLDCGQVLDANGRILIDEAMDGAEPAGIRFSSSEIERLVLAAPQLLEALKAVVELSNMLAFIVDEGQPEEEESVLLEAAHWLIARIEKGPNA
jgi:hypothetical protein